MDPHVPEGALNDEVDEPLRRHLERDPDEPHAEAVEDSPGYERAVEEGTVQSPSSADDPGAGDQAPEFKEPEGGA